MSDTTTNASARSAIGHSPLATGLTHALSFDIEDWFHIVEIKAVEDPSLWPGLSARSSLVERYTDLILKVCDDHHARATFFILGWIADRHPALIKRIADAGHEIGTHSFWHRKVYELSPDVFRKDIHDSIAAIRSGAGRDVEVVGFRAPSFSITTGAEWAFDVLWDLGIHYDASLFPGARGHGGYECEPGPCVVPTPAGRRMPELPMSLADLGLGPFRKHMCYSGGYLRLLPISLIRQGIEQEARAGRPTNIYLHPRDFAQDCPRVPMPLSRRFKCYVGLHTTEHKLRALLSSYKWAPCWEVLVDQESSGNVRRDQPLATTP